MGKGKEYCGLMFKLGKILKIFKAQYKKPAECYDMKDNAIRMHCANAFITG